METPEAIEQYLSGKLLGQDLLDFEEKLRVDPDFALEVKLNEHMNLSLSDKKEMELEQRLESIKLKYRSETAPKEVIPSIWRYIAIAASVLLIVSMGLILQRVIPSQTTTPRELFAENYAPYEGLTDIRSEDGVPKGALESAFKAYNSGDYGQALVQLEEILLLAPKSTRTRLYAGICLIETQNLSKSRAYFELILKDGQNLYLLQSEWYLALICLQQEDLSCAQEHLTLLAERPGAYQPKAKKILEKLAMEER